MRREGRPAHRPRVPATALLGLLGLLLLLQLPEAARAHVSWSPRTGAEAGGYNTHTYVPFRRHPSPLVH